MVKKEIKYEVEDMVERIKEEGCIVAANIVEEHLIFKAQCHVMKEEV